MIDFFQHSHKKRAVEFFKNNRSLLSISTTNYLTLALNFPAVMGAGEFTTFDAVPLKVPVIILVVESYVVIVIWVFDDRFELSAVYILAGRAVPL